MEDSHNSIIRSRKNLKEIPQEIFQLAQKQQIRVIDLGYNNLDATGIASLGDEDEKLKLKTAANLQSQSQRMLQSQRMTGVSSRNYTPLATQASFMSETSSRRNQPTGPPVPVAKLKDLEALFLGNNALRSLPDELSNLRTLKKLWLNANAITAFPPSFSVLGSLEVLSLNHNRLSRLPPHIAMLTSLQQLLLRSNRLGLPDSTDPDANLMAVLPEHLGLLTTLKVLDLAQNKLTTLPIELGRLHGKVERLNLELNEWRFPSGGIVEQGRSAVLGYLLGMYEEKLERYKHKARERDRALRTQPEMLGLTAAEAVTLLARSAVGSALTSEDGTIRSPLELDSGFQNT